MGPIFVVRFKLYTDFPVSRNNIEYINIYVFSPELQEYCIKAG